MFSRNKVIPKLFLFNATIQIWSTGKGNLLIHCSFQFLISVCQRITEESSVYFELSVRRGHKRNSP